MKIKKAILSPGRTGFYFDDQKAIKAGAETDGFNYLGEAQTPGFTAVRQPGESISIQLLLEDGQIALGDCAAVQYSGAGGRDPLFLAEDFIPILESVLNQEIVGRELSNFRSTMAEFEALEYEGKALHTAIRYGFSQALLDAFAKSKNCLPCEIIAAEYELDLEPKAIPIFTQSGDNRYDNVDKMIIKHVDVLPHALINNVPKKLGEKGEILKDYLKWLVERIESHKVEENYQPILHIDVYGTIGQIFGPDNSAGMAAYLKELADLAKPFKLRIEGPMDAGSKEAQISCLAALTERLDQENIPVELVADEWCNTLQDIKDFADAGAGHMIQIKTPDLGGIQNSVEAVLYCREKGLGAYQGGTCNETDRSAQICVQIAMASRPDQILAKPGMGVDEGFMICYNEMQRTIAYLEAKAEL
ncbi:MAG: methylaspartate ammonia-lyase [Eubacteriales bacterium]|nr:methylaspartate ammonia-lyase [Eubacteriales bacterium]